MKRSKLFFLFFIFCSLSAQAQKKLIFETLDYTSPTIQECKLNFKKSVDSLRKLDPPKYLIEFPSVYPSPNINHSSLDQYLSAFLKGKKRHFKEDLILIVHFNVTTDGELVITDLTGVENKKFKKKLINKLTAITWFPGECSGRKWDCSCILTLKVSLEK